MTSSTNSNKNIIALEVISASLGGAVSSAILYPLEVIKTKMQAGEKCSNDYEGDADESNDGNENQTVAKKNTTNVFDYAIDLYHRQGLKVFFDGIEVSALRSALEKACYFFSYAALKQLHHRAAVMMTKNRHGSAPQEQHLSVGSNLLLGCLAEWSHLPITLPIDTLVTTIQTTVDNNNQLKSDCQIISNSSKALAIWMTLWKDKKSLYKGIEAYYILCFKPALQYTIYEQLKHIMLIMKRKRKHQPEQHDHLSASEAFILGMFSRMIATIIVFPFVRAKVQMQSQQVSTEENADPAEEDATKEVDTTSRGNNHSNLWQLLLNNCQREGIQGLYQGMGPEIFRGVLSAALMMMVKERIHYGLTKTVSKSQ